MPTLNVKLHPLPDAATRQRLARALTALTAHTLGKRAAVTAVVFEAVDAHGWWIGGEPPQRPTALLAIRITAGTNSADEKQRFVEAAHAALQHHLAPQGALEEASYVVVEEVPAGDWGYDGLTQAARRRAHEPSPV